MEEDELELESLQEGEPGWGAVEVVKYIGTSDVRTLRRDDFVTEAREGELATDYLSWDAGNNHSLPLYAVVGLAGDNRERAMEVLAQHSHEFQLINADGTLGSFGEGAVEFAIGGVVD